MFDLEHFHNTAPYAPAKAEKQAMLLEAMRDLTAHHTALCPEYRRMLGVLGTAAEGLHAVEEVPFLPVRLFKTHSLRSIPPDAVQKTMTSSGTTGQQVSKIYLDKETSAGQTKALSRIVTATIGKKRLPMLIIDSKSVLKDRRMFSARGAGILGFSMYGYDATYALDDNMQLQRDMIEAFLEKHQGERILLFGFTFMVWQHFYLELKKQGFHPDLSQGVLIHGGGWKKLADQQVSSASYKAALREVCGLREVHDYYGMVEQTGSIYMECEHGHLHTPVYSDVIVRRAADFAPAAVGEEGILQVLSVLPRSYPGHSLLTEDRGVLLGEDDCPCGRKGRYFAVLGRLQNAEIRGCSDTYAAG